MVLSFGKIHMFNGLKLLKLSLLKVLFLPKRYVNFESMKNLVPQYLYYFSNLCMFRDYCQYAVQKGV